MLLKLRNNGQTSYFMIQQKMASQPAKGLLATDSGRNLTLFLYRRLSAVDATAGLHVG